MQSCHKSAVLVMCLAFLAGFTVPAVAAQSSEALQSPAQPLRAWTLSLDGTMLVVDAENRLYRLGVTDLAVEARSEPLFEADPDDRLYLAAGYTRVFVGSESAGRTIALSMIGFDQVAALDRAGPMAVDSNGKLMMISQRGIWAYNLMEQALEAELAVPGPEPGLGLEPEDLWVQQTLQRLYVLLHDRFSSPPHQREFFRVYSLSDMSERGTSEGELGTLTRPAFTPISSAFMATLYAKSPYYAANKLNIYDGSAGLIRSWQPLDGIPAISPDGLYVYLLRQRGVWVLSGKNMSVLSISFFTERPPADMLISPYGEILYLLGEGWLEAHKAEDVAQAGVHALSPFPLAWTDETTNHRPHAQVPQFHVFASPQIAEDGTALVQVADYGETYRTTDDGLSWNLVPSLAYPNLQETPPLSLSPELASDHTVVGRFNPIRQSKDGGVSWAEWSPRIAFVSDRSDDREIYTMDQDGSGVRRLTFDPASDEAPAWSPSWKRIAFQSNRSGNWDIFTVQADCDGTSQPAEVCDLRQLTDDASDDMLPAWSPDGRAIAFVSTRDGNPEIYVIPQTGGQPRRLTFDAAGDWRPVWMPDSRHLLFTSNRGGSNDIYSIEVPPLDVAPPTTELDLQPVVTGPSDDRDPALSVDNRLLFLSDRDGVRRAYYQDLDTPYASPLPVSQQRETEGHPAWIDDGGYGALVTLERNGVTDIFRTCSVCEYQALTEGQGFNGHPAWGPAWWRPDVPSSLEWLREHQ